MSTQITISDVSFKFPNKKSKVLAFGSITFKEKNGDFSITVKDLMIIDGNNGPFVGWPSKKVGERYFKSVILGEELAERINKAILVKYSEASKEKPKAQAPPRSQPKQTTTYAEKKEEPESDTASDDLDDLFN